MYLLVLALLGGDCVVPAKAQVVQKVIVEPQTVVQVDQFGNKRVVVQDFASVHHFGGYGYGDGSLAQQNAALTELLAENQRTMSQLLISQQQFQQQLLAAGVVTAGTAINIQPAAVPAPTHPGRPLFEQRCLVCHAAGNTSGVDLSVLDAEEICASSLAIQDGTMPKGGSLTLDESRLLGAYLRTELIRIRGQ